MNEILVNIQHRDFNAIILKQGAQLIHFQPTGSNPLFWSAQLSTFEKGRAFRGGIPICWPWFGKSQFPSHGFARIMDWTLSKRIDTDDRIILTWELYDSQQTRQIWPYKFTLVLTMILQKAGVLLNLTIKTSQKTTGALHTYFFVDKINDISISGLGEYYFDALNSEYQEKCEQVTKIIQEIDRVYIKPENLSYLVFSDRHIVIDHRGASDVVLWNPWCEKSKELIDMKENDYTHMVCIETARINTPLEPCDTLECELSILEFV